MRKQLSSLKRGQHRPTVPSAEEPNHLHDGLTTPKIFDFVPSVRRYSTGLLHSVRLTGIRSIARCRICNSSLSQQDCATPCPDRVLARDLQQITVPITARNFFFLPLISQARSRMQCHEGKHLLEQGCDPCTLPACCPLWDNSPCHQSIIGYVLAHGTPTNPCMKRQTTI